MDLQSQFFVVSLVATVAGTGFGYFVGRVVQAIDDGPSKFWYSEYENARKENNHLRWKLLREQQRQYDDGYRAHRDL
jgi:hypothetical protein